MSEGIAFRIGKWVAGHKLVTAGLTVAAFNALLISTSSEPEQVPQKSASLTAPVPAVPPCANDLDARVEKARERQKAKDSDGVAAALQDCRSVLAPGSEAEKLLANAEKAQMRAKEAAEAAAAKRERAQWRKEGVTVGMTAERALLSSWGKPQSVNRTTTSSGVREQWVYGGGNYLYFQDGILTSFQN